MGRGCELVVRCVFMAAVRRNAGHSGRLKWLLYYASTPQTSEYARLHTERPGKPSGQQPDSSLLELSNQPQRATVIIVRTHCCEYCF